MVAAAVEEVPPRRKKSTSSSGDNGLVVVVVDANCCVLPIIVGCDWCCSLVGETDCGIGCIPCGAACCCSW